MTKFTNALINSSSPYLLQHAHNPVNWYPWEEATLLKAKTENKPIIVSIGYSACHWCHVMEHESFENETVAKVMNENFICIKVDREERPDVDQIYMDAVHTMGLRGGWPLNVFLTSDALPFYGGTYFPVQSWISVCKQVATAYNNHYLEVLQSAESFQKSLNKSELQRLNLIKETEKFDVSLLELAFNKSSISFDVEWGGSGKAPKFPMPSNYIFLLRIWHQTRNQKALQQVVLTLKRMALGGIYDQVGGGFARYSTDREWFVPHFEKMLYDNAQLLSLYSEAYVATREPLFKRVVYETIEFVQQELTSHEGAFYSALDADSEGVEGKYYVWTNSEFNELLKEDYEFASDFYGIEAKGNWEHDFNILFCQKTLEEYCQENELSFDLYEIILKEIKNKLRFARNQRIKPGLDDKTLASWNGLMMNGLIDAYRAFDEENFLQMAIKNGNFIIQKMKNGSGLWHTFKDGKASIMGFLEDYAFVIQAFINLYEATFDEHWLVQAKLLMDYVLENFIDTEEIFLFFTDKNAEKLIARKKEIYDNVIPSSNSTMAINLWQLYTKWDKLENKNIFQF
ncbi:MAG: thioredoxin domain-containing protein [Bacteroidota bacterium]|nr:thioredoxin domain-containing protein [Bacteroidota bacterium]